MSINITSVPSVLHSSSKIDPVLQFLVHKIDEMMRLAEEALKTLERKLDESLGAIEGFLAFHSSTSTDQLTTSNTEICGLTQTEVALKNGIQDLLILKEELEQLEQLERDSQNLIVLYAEIKKECSSSENEIENKLYQIKCLIAKAMSNQQRQLLSKAKENSLL